MKAAALAIPVAFAFSLAISSTANAAPNPETCEGYPEPRVFMENQAWVEPQPGDSQHPGTGEQGHIHMFTCFPLNQRVTTDTIEFDVRIHLHNFPGEPKRLIWRPYLIGDNRTMGTQDESFPLPDGCPGADCSDWVHIEYDLSSLNRSGWTHFQILYKVALADGTTQWYNINRWPLYVDNGKPESTATPPERLRRLGGDTWIAPELGSSYSEASIDRSDYPWSGETGKLIPLSGVWNIDASFCCGHNNEATTGFASIDPLLHAQPEPDLGRVVYDGPAGKVPLSIDTTVLDDGIHRLLLSACNPQATETLTQCGVLVIRFLVDNTNQAFSDTSGNTFENDIDWLADKGITKGCNPPDNTRFCPDHSVTRGQMAAFINRYLDLPAASNDHFTDDNGTTFEADINRLAEAGITKGCNPPDNTRFCANDKVTRGQMAAFLVRALNLTANTHPGFNDVSSANTFYNDIGKLATAGITKGCNPTENTNYCPQDNATRGQMAAFIHRADEVTGS